MKIKGIKRGQNIELLEQIDSIPDGSELIVYLELYVKNSLEARQLLTHEERLAKLHQLFGAWKDQPELLEIFAEIDK
ncbi:MAG: hypothetical protein H0X31_05870 [Nostocaceae cyanobacterium]|nr:hypothetical protein [Nostocaceae cyanobacterium]